MISSIAGWISGSRPVGNLLMVWQAPVLGAVVEWLGVPVARLGPASTLSVAGWETRLIGCLMKRMTGVSPGSQSRRLEPFATVPPLVSMPSLGTAVPSALAANGGCRRFPGVSPLSSLLRMSLRL